MSRKAYLVPIVFLLVALLLSGCGSRSAAAPADPSNGRDADNPADVDPVDVYALPDAADGWLDAQLRYDTAEAAAAAAVAALFDDEAGVRWADLVGLACSSQPYQAWHSQANRQWAEPVASLLTPFPIALRDVTAPAAEAVQAWEQLDPSTYSIPSSYADDVPIVAWRLLWEPHDLPRNVAAISIGGYFRETDDGWCLEWPAATRLLSADAATDERAALGEGRVR